MRRVVFFLQGHRVPAARFRGVAIAKALAARGLEVDVRVAVPSVYGDLGRAARWPGLRTLFAPLALVSRLGQLGDLRSDDVVFFQRPMVELPTDWLERRVLARLPSGGRRPRSVFDFDDAIYLNRGTRHKFRRIVEMVDCVVAGNAILAEATGAPHKTRIIPTALDTARFALQAPRDTIGREVVIGWTGLASNYRQLAIAAAPIARVLARTGARFVLISDEPPPSALDGLRPEFVRWRADREVEDLSQLDVGVMPLPDTPYARGKCAFKLIEYMALGRPALASPVGVNTEVVQDGVNGFLPRSEAEWEAGLEALIADAGLRARVGAEARARVEARYALGAVLPAYLEILGGGRDAPPPSVSAGVGHPGWPS